MVLRFSVAALATALCAQTAVAQALPDILIGNADSRVPSILRLTDRNADGVFDSDPWLTDEVYDWFRVEPFYQNSEYRDIYPAPGRAGSYYGIDFGPNTPEPNIRIALFRDINFNGWISANEITPALTLLWFREGDMETRGMRYDGVGHVWSSDAGACEGIFYSRDLNNDGDFMDTVGGVEETVCLIAELTNRTDRVGEPAGGVIGSDNWRIYRNVNTPNANSLYTPTETQGVIWDSATSPGSMAGAAGILPGRYLFEEENVDQILALEDLNGDGDFIDTSDPNPANWNTDPGELYIWCALYSGGTLGSDVNPDVTAGLLPSTTDVGESLVVDTTSTPGQNIYYTVSRSTGNLPQANMVFRMVDVNFDGDVNDPGEVTVWFEAKDSDPFYPMQHTYSLSHWPATGDFFLVGDKWLPGGGNTDVILKLNDLNGDNVIDKTTEMTEVFTSPVDTLLRTPNLFNPGTVSILPPGLPAVVQYKNPATCVTTGNTTATLTVGDVTPGDNVPLIGQIIRVGIDGATPNAPSSMWIGFESAMPFPLSLIGLGPCTLNSTPITTVDMFTNATGGWTIQFAIPNDSSFVGLEQAYEGVALDIPNARVDVTNMAVLRYGRYSYTPPPVVPN